MTAPFLTVADIRLIEQQVNKILQAKLTSNDQKIVRGLAVTELRERLTHIDEDIIKEVEMVEDTIGAELFFQSLKSYTIPFKSISEQSLQKLFKKNKKLKLPRLETIDWQAISYLSWVDKGTNRQYIVLEKEGQYTALRGIVDTHTPVKGICAICNQHSAVRLFTATVTGNGDNYTSYSNYICEDAQLCNQRVNDYKKLEEFVARNLI